MSEKIVKPVVDMDEDADHDMDQENTQLEEAVGKIADGLVKAIEDHAPRKYIPFGRQRINSPFHKFDPDHPERSTSPSRHRKLDRIYYQNNARINVKKVTEEEIALLKKLRAGVYLDKMIIVTEYDSDFGPTVQIKYKTRTADQKQQIGAKVGSFVGMLQKIVAEAESKPKVRLE